MSIICEILSAFKVGSNQAVEDRWCAMSGMASASHNAMKEDEIYLRIIDEVVSNREYFSNYCDELYPLNLRGDLFSKIHNSLFAFICDFEHRNPAFLKKIALANSKNYKRSKEIGLPDLHPVIRLLMLKFSRGKRRLANYLIYSAIEYTEGEKKWDLSPFLLKLCNYG